MAYFIIVLFWVSARTVLLSAGRRLNFRLTLTVATSIGNLVSVLVAPVSHVLYQTRVNVLK